MAQNKRLLKKSLIGFEVEMFTLNKNGYMINAADKLLKKAKSDKNEGESRRHDPPECPVIRLRRWLEDHTLT